MDKRGSATPVVDFNLYLITDRKRINGRVNIIHTIEEALRGGVKAVQLREKDLAADELLMLARTLRALTNRYGAKLIINNRIDVAMIAKADGVQLGQGEISPRDARTLIGTDKLIGVSTHNIEEVTSAEEGGADFITFGPVFRTESKAKYGEPLGTSSLRRAVLETRCPVFAIGGIRKENINEIMLSGADGIALISAIISSSDPCAEAEQIIRKLVECSSDNKH